jgi:hypothetical protein
VLKSPTPYKTIDSGDCSCSPIFFLKTFRLIAVI